jgi:malonate transporter and related proteins
MATIFAALMPVALLIALGLVLQRANFLEAGGWVAAERLVYYVLFPALLFLELARADLSDLPVLRLAVVMVLVQVTMAGFAVAMSAVLRLPGSGFTSLLQAVTRWNSYVAIALAPLLFGPEGGAVMALAVAVITPIANFMAVAALARHGHGHARGALGFLRAVGSNPLIIACLAGILWNLFGLHMPEMLGRVLELLARGALALGLLAVGAGLRALPMAAAGPALGAAIAGKLVLSPLLAAGLGWFMGLEALELGVLVLACGVPTSSSSYILARLLGGDADLMAGIITTQTAIALITLPLMLLLVT